MEKRSKELISLLEKYKWYVITIIIILFPFSMGYIVALPKWSYWHFGGDANTWITFWGAYAGAIASFLMACITYKTLQSNDKQLQIIEEQNSPHLYPYVEIVNQGESTKKGTEWVKKYYDRYYLFIHNYGNRIATNVSIDIFPDSILEDTYIKQNIENIRKTRFALLPGETKSFYLYYCITPENHNNREKSEEFIRKLEESQMTLRICCDNQEPSGEKFVINLKDAPFRLTSVVQALDYMNQSIKTLGEKIEDLTNK